jgi:endoglucanase
MDASGKRLKLAAVSWYGAESADFVVGGLDRRALDDLAALVRTLGFNAVRLPWSNQLVESNPVVDAPRLAANPALQGLRALDVLDRVVAALARQGLLVILDNHLSAAGWCCSDTDGNGLWYTTDYPESAWLADWAALARRYRSQPAVIGAELRNELRPAGGVSPTWGDGAARTDWKAAAERGAAAVLQENPGLLVFVQGLSYSTDLQGAYRKPVSLPVADRLVYAPHDYPWFHKGGEAFDALHTALGNQWGFLLVQGQPYTAPVWVSEFGTCNTAGACVSAASGDGLWFQSFSRYLADADIDWAYWPLNGTESTGASRTLGAAETYGVLGTDWSAASRGDLLAALRALQPATQGP